MREIKFRAWDRTKKTMTNEFIVCADGTVYRDRGTTDDGGIAWAEVGEQMQLDDSFLPNLEVMQFTGLLDKNGKDIFEGDVVEFTDKWEWYRGTYAIPMMFAVKEAHADLKAKYEAEPMHRFEVTFDPFIGFNLSQYDLGEGRYAVIGNIYENPELLDDKR